MFPFLPLPVHSTTYQTQLSSQVSNATDRESPAKPRPREAHSSPARSMDLLEHPFEAVAFRLYSLPIPEAASTATGAAAWTCLAAVLAAAAAAGFWRLRSSTPAAVAVAVSTKPLELDPSPVAEVSSPELSKPSSQRSPPKPAAESTAAPSPKERYTAYYRDAGCVGCCDAGSDEDGDDENEEEDNDVAEEREDGGDRDVFVSDGADPFGWGEVVIRPLRLPLSPTAAAAEEMGLRYRRSPTVTALSGSSVVQLWDQGAGGGLTPTASPRRRGRVVAGTVVSAF
ncbi:hypothetical protein BDA96_10G087800 [Sorghum bicolor]|uniref:Uncharacterized protein n=1 Tax=Sorghum bicolor TaxID=4558 RepID=A0A921Q1Z3_SORBI|nr:hypothetical protein BDA96_10G087800 [Sorghum bicolor]